MKKSEMTKRERKAYKARVAEIRATAAARKAAQRVASDIRAEIAYAASSVR